MTELISLKVNCPVCGHSLMDNENLVDNCPSIMLKINIDDNEGIIRLSSVWESYNYTCDIETPKDSLVKLSCSHCNSEITKDAECEHCSAPMIPFNLELGGKVDICSRIGCKNHFVKFVDFSFALKSLFNETELDKMPYYSDMTMTGNTHDDSLSEEKEHVEIIKTGTFLHAFCQHCRKTLIEGNMIKLKVVREGDEGFIMLSPYLNVYTSKSTLFLKEGELIGDLRCFNCDESLMVKDKECDECKSEVFKIALSARSRLLDFYICSKKGCRWHGLSQEDLKEIKLEDSLEW